jgi:hypothetical protein
MNENFSQEMNLEDDVVFSEDSFLLNDERIDLDEYDTNLEYGNELARRGVVLYLNY